LAISESETDIHLKAQSYRVASEAVDGMDVVAVEAAARRAVAAIHGGSGPFFLECRTYRFRAHSMFDAQLYRAKAEVEAWKQRCPIARLTEWAKASSLIHDDDIAALEREIAAEVQASVDFSEAGTWEPVADLCRDVTTPREAR
jgi:TPP-dependent pyruvate/acetoin dehydrogenase alpha subunit